jgi:hypothetical protein
MPNPLLWDTHSPHLYTLEATLTTTDHRPPTTAATDAANRASPVTHHSSLVALDTLSSTFGMRTIAASPDGRAARSTRTTTRS